MRIELEVDSAVAMQTYRIEVLLPPFATLHPANEPIMRSSTTPWARPLSPAEVSRTELEEYRLSLDQALVLSEAANRVHIGPSKPSSSASTTIDGCRTKLTLDLSDCQLTLKWLCDPPMEWIGVQPLCDAINHLFIDLQRKPG